MVSFSRYTQFVQGQNLKDSQCIVFAHHRPSAADLTRTQLRKFGFVCILSSKNLHILSTARTKNLHNLES